MALPSYVRPPSVRAINLRFELADRLKAMGVPFLFFTGYDKEIIPQRFADVARLEKPMNDAKLVAAAKSLCD